MFAILIVVSVPVILLTLVLLSVERVDGEPRWIIQEGKVRRNGS